MIDYRNISEMLEDGDDDVEGIGLIFERWVTQKEIAGIIETNDTIEDSDTDTDSDSDQVSKNKPDKETLYTTITSDGIMYSLTSWIEWEKNSVIEFHIWSEKFRMESFGFFEKWKNFSVWIEVKDRKSVENKVMYQLKNQTIKTNKNLKHAIDGMLSNIKSLLQSKDTLKQILASEIRKYAVT